MNPLCTLLCAASTIVGLASAAAGQVAATQDRPVPAGDHEMGQPVMDRMIFVHGILDQFEGRTDGRSPDFRWSGEGWVGTDYDKFWVKTEGFRRTNGTVDDGKHEFLYSRAISTYFDLQGGCAATSIPSGTATGLRWVSRGLRRSFSASKAQVM
jgi:copper resistance protein B